MKRTGFLAAAAALLSCSLLFIGCDDFDQHDDSIVRTMIGIDDEEEDTSSSDTGTDDTTSNGSTEEDEETSE